MLVVLIHSYMVESVTCVCTFPGQFARREALLRLEMEDSQKEKPTRDTDTEPDRWGGLRWSLLLWLFIFQIVTDIQQINTIFRGVQFVIIPSELYSCDL